MKLGATENYEMIPIDHKCKICSCDKAEVNFTVYLRNNRWYPKRMCGKCTNGHRGHTRIARDTRIRNVSSRIKKYFEEK